MPCASPRLLFLEETCPDDSTLEGAVLAVCTFGLIGSGKYIVVLSGLASLLEPTLINSGVSREMGFRLGSTKAAETPRRTPSRSRRRKSSCGCIVTNDWKLMFFCFGLVLLAGLVVGELFGFRENMRNSGCERSLNSSTTSRCAWEARYRCFKYDTLYELLGRKSTPFTEFG